MTKITIDQVSYRRMEKEILQNVSFTLDEGTRLAVLGPNGAGKTTLFELITGILRPDKGRIYFDDRQTFDQAKRSIGVLWDSLRLFPWLKVKEVIHYVSAMYGLPKLPNIYYGYLELNKIEHSLMQTLSQGEQKRVCIYLAMLGSPDLLILDEPTSELDPFIREKIWKHIFLPEDKTLLFSTHHWEEAADYATHIAFMHNGKMLNVPCPVAALLSNTRLMEKIVVGKDVTIKNSETLCQYEEEQHRIYLLTQGDENYRDEIKRSILNYSILPIGLKDVYQYLIYTTR